MGVSQIHVRPHSSNSIKNATPSSGISPLASYKEVPSPGLFLVLNVINLTETTLAAVILGFRNLKGLPRHFYRRVTPPPAGLVSFFKK